MNVAVMVYIKKLYQYLTWFFALREEHRSIIFENKVLREIFGPKKKKEHEG
jgi:hypothetical protein